MRKEKGITLIALVIMIIVLLILAGVTIITLTGDNGLLQKAGEVKIANELAEIEEKVKLKTLENENQKLINEGIENLNLDINENIINKYKDLLYVKDSKLYLSFIVNYPQIEAYKNNKDLIEVLKDKLEVTNDSIKVYNKVINPYFDDGLNSWGVNNESKNIVEVINENGNNYVHLDMKYKDGGYTTYIGKVVNNISNQDNDKVYINIKYRNQYASSQDNLRMNNIIILSSRAAGGYTDALLRPNQYISNYNKGFVYVSEIRNVSKNDGLYLAMGGDQSFSSSWEYKIDFDDVYAINLTEIFGAGNEPTKDEMDGIFNDF